MAAVVACQADEDFTPDKCFMHPKTNQSEDFDGHVCDCDTILKEYRDNFYKNLARSFDESSENVDCMITYLKKIEHDKAVLRASHLENLKNVSELKLKRWQASKSALLKVSLVEVSKSVILNYVHMIEASKVFMCWSFQVKFVFSIYSNVKTLREFVWLEKLF